MKIGITEYGDAGLDFTWYEKIKHFKDVDGAILITKEINAKFIDKVMDLYRSGFTQLIVHCTCTGWGGTVIEPNVPNYKDQITMLEKLINCGFPKSHCVLRIDPIFPTENGINRVTEVLDYAYKAKFLPEMRVRISVLDEYKHVKERFKDMGFSPIYGDSFYAPRYMMQNLVNTLEKYDLQFECCAEPYLNNKNQYVHTGCISERDLRIMGFPENEIQSVIGVNPQNRKGCLCLSCKTELLPRCNRHQCDHKCAYCFWKN